VTHVTSFAGPLGLDPFGTASAHLSAEAIDALAGLRRTLERDVEPLLAAAWQRGSLPPEILAALLPLELIVPPGVTTVEADSSLFSGFRNFVLARTDASVATLYNAQSGLFRTAIQLGGDAAQRNRLEQGIRDFSIKGAFALTEPAHGSDIAGGLETRAERAGDTWTLNGAKRWIGAAAEADLLVVFARDTADGEIKAFLVPRDAPGVRIRSIENKIALRIMPNADVELDAVLVAEADRLQQVHGWRDVSAMLARMRSGVAWIATGLQAGALEAALDYASQREQFGRPVAGFQLVQEKLARMLGNLAASLSLVIELSRHEDAGTFHDEASALSKMQTARLARETVALGREVLGGNGIVLDHRVARFFADAEAIYSYEGSHEMNALVVGRALTGLSAFR
jgi:glutaryl-CoA dehydrogenase